MSNKIVIFNADLPEQRPIIERLLRAPNLRVHLHADSVTPELAQYGQHKHVQLRLGVRQHAAMQMATAYLY